MLGQDTIIFQENCEKKIDLINFKKKKKIYLWNPTEIDFVVQIH